MFYLLMKLASLLQTVRFPIDSLLIPCDHQEINVESGAVRERTLEIMRAVARENILRSQDAYKAHYDKKAAWSAYVLGDEVLLYSPASPIGHTRLRKLGLTELHE